eukprot:scaffold97593_cov29-Prasinocladus_malaysianus.AAC.1
MMSSHLIPIPGQTSQRSVASIAEQNSPEGLSKCKTWTALRQSAYLKLFIRDNARFEEKNTLNGCVPIHNRAMLNGVIKLEPARA